MALAPLRRAVLAVALNADAGLKVWRAATKERLESKYAQA